MTLRTYLSIIVIAILTASCNQNPSDEALEAAFKPRHEGLVGELMVVATEEQMKSPIGEAIESSFIDKAYQVTPQMESVFKVFTKTPEQFKKYFKRYRNVVLFNIGQTEKHLESKVTLHRDLFSQDQLVFEVFAESRTIAAEVLDSKADFIIDLIEQKEVERLQMKYAKINNRTIASLLEMEYEFSMIVPKQYELRENRPDFAWLLRPQQGMGQEIALEKGIMIYTYPYVNDSTFTPEFLFAKRDSILRHNVPGLTKGSYMSTEYGHGVHPVATEITHKGDFAMEIKGVWKVEHGFMGGSYVSLTKLDEKNNRVVTIEGYVYAPHEGKREHIRSVEAVIKTIDFNFEQEIASK